MSKEEEEEVHVRQTLRSCKVGVNVTVSGQYLFVVEQRESERE